MQNLRINNVRKLVEDLEDDIAKFLHLDKMELELYNFRLKNKNQMDEPYLNFSFDQNLLNYHKRMVMQGYDQLKFVRMTKKAQIRVISKKKNSQILCIK